MPPSHVQVGSLYSPRGERKYVTSAERERFIAAAIACERPDLRSLAMTLAYTGVRISECLALRVGSVDTDQGFVAVRTLKRRSRIIVVREVPIPDSLVRLLSDTHGIVGAEPTRRLWPMSRSRAWQLIKSLMATAMIPPGIHSTPKGLRHGFGLHAVRCGVPINLIQRWLGHARLETTAIYLQAMGVEEREFASKMWMDATKTGAIVEPSKDG